MGTIESVNVGQVEEVTYEGRTFKTGFRKRPVPGPIAIGELMLEGDVQCCMHLGHGTNAKAIYAYAREDYECFASQYGIDPEPGLFHVALRRDSQLGGTRPLGPGTGCSAGCQCGGASRGPSMNCSDWKL